ncbi:hypothetical protein CVT26_003348 [Gymnopilus dilepis]|uniref:Uncharacterized protein n=1 Tax=Gymnopilus dilepis TaxID=231916 RepID=A0A409VQI0_9AGAR|nr:hypothetical protein CVT26_003348 [Gymnopilus dilepis]
MADNGFTSNDAATITKVPLRNRPPTIRISTVPETELAVPKAARRRLPRTKSSPSNSLRAYYRDPPLEIPPNFPPSPTELLLSNKYLEDIRSKDPLFLRPSPSTSSLRTLKVVRRQRSKSEGIFEDANNDADTPAGPSTPSHCYTNSPSSPKQGLFASVRQRVASLTKPSKKGKSEGSGVHGASGGQQPSRGIENFASPPLRRATSMFELEDAPPPEVLKDQISGLDAATREASRRAEVISSRWRYDDVDPEEEED